MFLMSSHFGTVVSVSGDNNFYHAYPEEVYPDLCFDIDGHIIRAPEGFSKLHDIETRREGDSWVIVSNGQFMCADIGGAISWRTDCLAMEKFTLMPIENYVSIQEGRIRIPRKRQTNHISRTVHQIFLNGQLPSAFETASEQLRKMNPDWEYVRYDAKDILDFIYDFYGWEILKLYLQINPRYGAARADLFRYLCIYQKGGVYLDIKATTRNPLDSFIRPDDQYLLSRWKNGHGEPHEGCGLGPEMKSFDGGEYQQWHIIAAKGHPFLESVINDTITRIHKYREDYVGCGKLGVLRLTGPYVYTTSINKNITKYRHRFFDYHESGLIYNFINGYDKLFKTHYSKENTPIVL
ncbi:glycosyltransferase family 32 protein [Komagataeibacter medellinensis]|uniref:Glycosyltransferase n=1 Tax=Komagataeibacter medellinensis (strain NBRC 3288 / BCRC 11682 / LMG 1693 / Kondo 51) TaxID=634177 RepID=G2I3W8_KOMMN|nr:glycosyltransferase [Komagataeibacter medellinensis]BAK82815.1 glycosyltransferase [Komagataeibacter medellinensis NBRC 3288]